MATPDDGDLGAERPAEIGDAAAHADRFATNGDHVIVASGEVDIYTAPKLWEALARLIEEGHREVVVDFAAVEFMDSQGVAVIVQAHKVLQSSGGMVTIRSPRAQARTVLEATGLIALIQLED